MKGAIFFLKMQDPSIANLLLIYKQTSHTHSCTNTHARQEDLLPCPPALTQTSDNLSCSSRAKRVTQGNGTSLGVHLGPVKTQLITAVDCHGGEGLIDLDNVNIGQAQTVLGEKLGDSDAGTDTHDTRSQTRNGGANILGHDGLAELDGGGALHEKNSGGWEE